MEAHTQKVLDLLKAVPAGEAEWEASCPAHQDRKASLSIGVGGDGRTLLHCHAGCDVLDVLKAIKLEPRDLFPPANGHSGNGHATKARKGLGTIIATYPYRDEKNKLLYEVLRYSPKDFRQRRPTESGLVWNLKGVRRTLYRLSQLLASTGPVFIVEGERDVDRLTSLGFTATTNAQGAGKWEAAFADFLVGRDVVILPDNDEPGRAHAQQVARTLVGKARAIKILELPDLPEKGDVSDFLDAGGTRDKLIELVRAAPLWTPPADIEDSTPTPPTEKQIEEADDDPHRLARVVMAELPNLRY